MRRLTTSLFLATAVFAAPRIGLSQAHPDFSGKWVLDVSQSQGQMVPQSSEMTVRQTDNMISVTRMSQTDMGPQTTIATVTLDGKPSMNPMAAQGMTIEFSSSAAWDGATLVITTDATVNGQALHQIDHWTLDADKKVATENTNYTVGDQAASLKLVYNKK